MLRFAQMGFLLIAVLPAPLSAGIPVSFQTQIAPLLHRRCGTCHDAEQAKGRYRMDTFEKLMKPGDSDLPPVVARKPQESELYRLLLEHNPEDRMPQKADPLPDSEIALIEQWIAEGATCDASSPKQPLVEMVRHIMLRAAPEKYAHSLPISALAFSPDGEQVAVSGYYEVTLWKVSDGTLVTRIAQMPERITSVAWHPRLPLLAVAGGTPMQWGTIALVDPINLAPTRYLCDLPEAALSVAFSPDGDRLAAGCGDRTVRLYDPGTGRQRRVLKLHADWVQAVVFSADSQRLLTVSRDRTARVLDAGKGDVLASYTSHETALLAGAFSPGDSRAWTIARGGTIHRWDTASGEKKGEFKGTDFVSLLPLGKAMLAVAADRKLRLYEADKLTATWDGPDTFPASATLSTDGSTVAIGGADGSVTMLESISGKVLKRFIAQPQ